MHESPPLEPDELTNASSRGILLASKLHEEIDLETCVAASFEPERRERKCHHCGHSYSLVKPSVTALPRVLALHLKRFHGLKSVSANGSVEFDHVKIDKPVRISPELDLTAYLHSDVRGPPPDPWGPGMAKSVMMRSSYVRIAPKDVIDAQSGKGPRKEQSASSSK